MKKFSLILLTLFLTTTSLYANIGPQGFVDYKNDYFVETGTFAGGGIRKALEAGFKYVRSIDVDNKHVQSTKQHFRKNKNVKIWVGDSAKGLWKMIKGIKVPITFWLDAHVFPPI